MAQPYIYLSPNDILYDRHERLGLPSVSSGNNSNGHKSGSHVTRKGSRKGASGTSNPTEDSMPFDNGLSLSDMLHSLLGGSLGLSSTANASGDTATTTTTSSSSDSKVLVGRSSTLSLVERHENAPAPVPTLEVAQLNGRWYCSDNVSLKVFRKLQKQGLCDKIRVKEIDLREVGGGGGGDVVVGDGIEGIKSENQNDKRDDDLYRDGCQNILESNNLSESSSHAHDFTQAKHKDHKNIIIRRKSLPKQPRIPDQRVANTDTTYSMTGYDDTSTRSGPSSVPMDDTVQRKSSCRRVPSQEDRMDGEENSPQTNTGRGLVPKTNQQSNELEIKDGSGESVSSDDSDLELEPGIVGRRQGRSTKSQLSPDKHDSGVSSIDSLPSQEHPNSQKSDRPQKTKSMRDRSHKSSSVRSDPSTGNDSGDDDSFEISTYSTKDSQNNSLTRRHHHHHRHHHRHNHHKQPIVQSVSCDQISASPPYLRKVATTQEFSNIKQAKKVLENLVASRAQTPNQNSNNNNNNNNNSSDNNNNKEVINQESFDNVSKVVRQKDGRKVIRPKTPEATRKSVRDRVESLRQNQTRSAPSTPVALNKRVVLVRSQNRPNLDQVGNMLENIREGLTESPTSDNVTSSNARRRLNSLKVIKLNKDVDSIEATINDDKMIASESTPSKPTTPRSTPKYDRSRSRTADAIENPSDDNSDTTKNPNRRPSYVKTTSKSMESNTNGTTMSVALATRLRRERGKSPGPSPSLAAVPWQSSLRCYSEPQPAPSNTGAFQLKRNFPENICNEPTNKKVNPRIGSPPRIRSLREQLKINKNSKLFAMETNNNGNDVTIKPTVSSSKSTSAIKGQVLKEETAETKAKTHSVLASKSSMELRLQRQKSFESASSTSTDELPSPAASTSQKGIRESRSIDKKSKVTERDAWRRTVSLKEGMVSRSSGNTGTFRSRQSNPSSRSSTPSLEEVDEEIANIDAAKTTAVNSRRVDQGRSRTPDSRTTPRTPLKMASSETGKVAAATIPRSRAYRDKNQYSRSKTEDIELFVKEATSKKLDRPKSATTATNKDPHGRNDVRKDLRLPRQAEVTNDQNIAHVPRKRPESPGLRASTNAQHRPTRQKLSGTHSVVNSVTPSELIGATTPTPGEEAPMDSTTTISETPVSMPTTPCEPPEHRNDSCSSISPTMTDKSRSGSESEFRKHRSIKKDINNLLYDNPVVSNLHFTRHDADSAETDLVVVEKDDVTKTENKVDDGRRSAKELVKPAGSTLVRNVSLTVPRKLSNTESSRESDKRDRMRSSSAGGSTGRLRLLNNYLKQQRTAAQGSLEEGPRSMDVAMQSSSISHGIKDLSVTQGSSVDTVPPKCDSNLKRASRAFNLAVEGPISSSSSTNSPVPTSPAVSSRANIIQNLVSRLYTKSPKNSTEKGNGLFRKQNDKSNQLPVNPRLGSARNSRISMRDTDILDSSGLICSTPDAHASESSDISLDSSEKPEQTELYPEVFSNECRTSNDTSIDSENELGKGLSTPASNVSLTIIEDDAPLATSSPGEPSERQEAIVPMCALESVEERLTIDVTQSITDDSSICEVSSSDNLNNNKIHDHENIQFVEMADQHSYIGLLGDKSEDISVIGLQEERLSVTNIDDVSIGDSSHSSVNDGCDTNSDDWEDTTSREDSKDEGQDVNNKLFITVDQNCTSSTEPICQSPSSPTSLNHQTSPTNPSSPTSKFGRTVSQGLLSNKPLKRARSFRSSIKVSFRSKFKRSGSTKRKSRKSKDTGEPDTDPEDELFFMYDRKGRGHRVPLDVLSGDCNINLCWVCGKSYKSQYSLQQHKRTRKH